MATSARPQKNGPPTLEKDWEDEYHRLKADHNALKLKSRDIEQELQK
jgi:hypothetical protein